MIFPLQQTRDSGCSVPKGLEKPYTSGLEVLLLICFHFMLVSMGAPATGISVYHVHTWCPGGQETSDSPDAGVIDG